LLSSLDSSQPFDISNPFQFQLSLGRQSQQPQQQQRQHLEEPSPALHRGFTQSSLALQSSSQVVSSHLTPSQPGRLLTEVEQIPNNASVLLSNSTSDSSSTPYPNSSESIPPDLRIPGFHLGQPASRSKPERISAVEDSYHCSVCGEEFKKSHLRRKHYYRKHNKRFKCTVPGCRQDPFGLKADLRRHERSCHPDMFPVSSFPCTVPGCSSRYSRLDNLKRHIRSSHSCGNETLEK
jgi:hypothetical protein